MDRFGKNRDAVSNPARATKPILPSDSTDLGLVPKAIFIGSGGDITLRCIDDINPVTFRNVREGTILPVRAAKIFAQGTTADHILGLY